MHLNEILALFAERVRFSSERPDVFYFKQRGCAVHRRPTGAPAPGAALVLNDGEIAVYRDEPPAGELEQVDRILTPVYALQPSGAPAVPTGLVFLRFAEGTAETRRLQIQQCGYDIDQLLPYAPQATWVRRLSGDIAEALSNLSALAALPDVVNVEPQMLMESHRR